MEISKKKDLLTKEIEMRFVIIAFPGYPGVCLMIARVFVRIDLQNDDCVSPRMSDPRFLTPLKNFPQTIFPPVNGF